ncbi:anti-sigma factor [Gordonia bronchialis DSM 43247]|uniref:Anti-sigma factor n=1 Tax=Gordonia bronchialis (strain ATCC 25592 / DSM 43247 / BCRC 13721 / JCM 3198 / KCTC 3076 / NBRC 16047 / NCTC 10667) TaxID=526226 RepID=D0LF22_GORB4|nr:mycothiol system anti-sigma-R factor [Gordonia bronchialis]ACY22717.1 anti-sigma factor [Gordonia bronchialis DSM 43247]MCC3325499.1 mycothiol system anti-sigma-R factor [Gordonia bronchialis]QGS23824.1 mycothiol system anti-sigma-R factor [Gordonia bronchialis]STQ65658.1 Predicted transmembrane transcriptional regulator (anti-sigma factor) [Gordonia bronchialis]
MTSDLDPEFTSMDCSAVIADVWLLLDNECDPGARARLQEHLDACPACLAHYGIEQQLKALINRKCGGDQAPAGLRERLRVEIRKTVIVHETSVHTDASGDPER